MGSNIKFDWCFIR